jgi:hypothetical protein
MSTHKRVLLSRQGRMKSCHSAGQRELENIMLGKMRWTQKNKYHMFSLNMWKLKKVNLNVE